jgi:hypothetical protein
MRWYKLDGSFNNSSSSTAQVTLISGQWVSFSISGTAPAGVGYAGIEIGSSGGDNNAYLFVDELQLEAGTTATGWTPGGSIFNGYIEKWPVSVDGLTASVDVTAVDGLGILGTTELRRPMQQAILNTAPLGYWTLGDPVDSIALVNLANDQQPAKLVGSKFGGATPLLGATSIVAKDDTACFSLANVATNKGTVVDICDGGKRNYPLGNDFSVAFWTNPVRPSAGQWVTLFAGWSDTGDDFLNIRMDSGGFVQVNSTFTDGTVETFTSSYALSSGSNHFIMVHVNAGNTRLYCDGDLRTSFSGSLPSNLDIRDLRWASFGGRQAGSVYSEYSNGRHAHLAIWDRAVTWAEQAEIWQLGAGSALTELESARIARLADYAGFTGDLVYDVGMSTVQEPSWDNGTTALDEIQTTAADAAGYAFIDGDGRLTYHSRVRRQAAPVRYVLGDSSGLPYEPGLSFDMDEAKIVNEVSYRRTNGIEGVVRDSASVATYGRKSTSIERRITLDSEIQDAAYSLLNQYSTPGVRCDSVTLNATATNALFLIALGVEVGDRITLGDLPVSAPGDAADFYVEAVNISATADGGTPVWTATLSLSPASLSDVWVLEDPVLGRIDRTAVLAY